ncbi:MAG: histidine phosphatase family protein [Clostridia bacterium]|nr:histidine phosphatase family protein [Clostridia bacterium]
MLLYLIRHGKPDYTTDSLLPQGVLQAEAVGKRLAASGINKVFSSPMGRARQTAEPTCRLLGLDCKIEDWAHEVEDERLTPYPDGVLKSVTRVQNTLYRVDGKIDLPYDRAYECDGFSSSRMQEAVRRIELGGKDFLQRLGYKQEGAVYRIIRPNDDRVALFCHSVMGRAWLSTLLHIPIHLMWSGFLYTYTGVTVVEFKNNPDGYTAPTCLCYSDMSHLYAHGPDMLHDDHVFL